VLETEKALEVIDLIHSHDMKCGVAISPQTPSTAITDQIGEKADMLLVMTVHPGAGGQKFMEECVPKVRHGNPHLYCPNTDDMRFTGIGSTSTLPQHRHPSRRWSRAKDDKTLRRCRQ